jgi:hypothetical protein
VLGNDAVVEPGVVLHATRVPMDES